MARNSQKTVFLDRDGVLNVDHGYVSRPDDLELFPDVVSSLAKLQAKGFQLIVVTNQSGVARGYFTLADVHAFHSHMSEVLAQNAITIAKYYICPHHKDGTVAEYAVDCLCRKPRPGMLRQAFEEFDIDRKNSFLIGDKISDIDCGQAMELRSVQIDRGQYPVHESPFAVETSLANAVDLILKTFAHEN
ncbi:MAG: HAD family hydrolase [Pseudobacteriovorax sp.]|nr:HAD family hydrolase [Pseudobacteriovorax sp.]